MKTPSEEDIALLADRIDERLTYVAYEKLPGLLVEAAKLAAVTAATSGAGQATAIAARSGKGAKAVSAVIKALNVAKAKVATSLVAKSVTQAGQTVALTRSTRAVQRVVKQVLPPDRINAIANRAAVLAMPWLAKASEEGRDRDFSRALAQALSDAGVANALARELPDRVKRRLGTAMPQAVKNALDKALTEGWGSLLPNSTNGRNTDS